MAKRVVAKASEEPAASGATARRLDRRLAWIAAAAAVLAVSTFLAVWQAPRPDPYDVPGLFSLSWFLSPVETHPEQRLPAVAGEVRALWTSGDGKRVWAVGDGGLVLRSADGGGTWERVVLRGAAQGGEEAPPVSAAAANLSAPGWPLDLPGGPAAAQDAKPEPVDPKQALEQRALEGDLGPELLVPQGGPPEQRVPDPQRLDPPMLLRGSRQEASEVAALAAPAATPPDWLALVPFTPLRAVPATNMLAVHFLPYERHGPYERYGWIAGEGGLLLRTVDGGASWEERLTEVAEERFAKLAFVMEEIGCAQLGSGSMARTRDGGASWATVERSVDIPGCPSWVHEGPEGSAAKDVLLLSLEVWSGRWRSGHSSPVAVRFAVPEPGRDRHRPGPATPNGAWAAIEGGLLAVSRDGGATWRLSTRSARFGIRSLHFLDEERGFAGGRQPGEGGFIERTDDGGRTWTHAIEGLEGAVVDLGFLADSGTADGFGWAASDAGELYVTTDRGSSWRRQEVVGTAPPSFADVELLAPAVGVAVDGEGELWSTSDGGVRWATRGVGSWNQVVELTAAAEEVEALAVVQDGQVVTNTAVSGLVHGRTPFFGRVQKHGDWLWLGGGGGLFRGAFEGSYQEVLPFEPLADPSPVSAFFFLDDDRGWRAEPGGGLLATTDGGRTWTDLTPHAIWPAPWYWLAVLAGIALLVPAVAPPPPGRIEHTIAEVAVSDRPIGPADPDPLRFDRVARGLSRFLRNTATRPPLTVAVVGEWGTGKSSLMNLVHADLERYGFRPVWFNAWHHQKEEQLLAALLENIRRQAVPSWLRPEGWVFRGRLLGERLRRWFVPALVAMIVFGVGSGWLMALDKSALDGLREALELPVAWIERLVGEPGDGDSRAGSETPQPLLLGWLVSAAGLAYTFFRGLRAFGIKPAQLAAGLSEHARVRDIAAQTGFRYRFAREFADVTRALSPRTLTVMIDDLDRCRPQNVLDVLEAINFLVSSGECFVLLGIDRERVERCVGWGFRDVAEELLDRESAADGGAEPGEAADEAGRRRRAVFARQYLEKLINIEVPVPRASAETGVELLRPAPPPSTRPTRLRRLADGARRQTGRWWLLPATLLAALALGLGLGVARQEAGEPVVVAGGAGVEPPVTVTSAPSAEPGAAGPTAGSDGATDATAAEGPSPQPVGFAPAAAGERPSLALWALAALLVAGVGAWTLTTLPEVEVHDSPQFLDALARWYPLLHSHSPTPRSTKRFLNRVRFYAMGQRAAELARSRFEAMLTSLPWRRPDTAAGYGASPAPPVDAVEAIPERVLVALTAVQHTHPEWLAQDGFWISPQTYLGPRAPEPLPILEWQRYRQAFERLSRGVESR